MVDKLNKENLSNISLLILDLDGVFTDGTIIIDAHGNESKRFSVIDGHGITLWHRASGKSAIISGRYAKATTIRAEQLGIEYVFQDCKQKLPVFERLLGDLNLEPQQVAYIGDDLLDIPLIVRAGFGVAVANAADEVKRESDYITKNNGGNGAIREVVELILKVSGKWQALMERYLV